MMWRLNLLMEVVELSLRMMGLAGMVFGVIVVVVSFVSFLFFPPVRVPAYVPDIVEVRAVMILVGFMMVVVGYVYGCMDGFDEGVESG